MGFTSSGQFDRIRKIYEQKGLETVSIADAAYTAGIIDGEGCLQIDKELRLVMTVVMTEKSVIEWLCHKWGSNLITYPPQKGIGTKRRWRWRKTGHAAVAVLKVIRPYMIVKQKQADIGLTWALLEDRGAPVYLERASLRISMFFANGSDPPDDGYPLTRVQSDEMLGRGRLRGDDQSRSRPRKLGSKQAP